MDPEKAHHLTMKLASTAFGFPGLSHTLQKQLRPPESQPLDIMGIKFPNRIGLAAGFDKDGKYLSILEKLGFGHIEVGTVTPRPQSGNPTPRLFRLPKDKALINRMGFNNEGLDALIGKLSKLGERSYILGGNIGKNKDTPNESAHLDYIKCFTGLAPYVDYFAINISSPNTPGLRELQEKEPLKKLLFELQELNTSLLKAKPVLLKISPDITKEQLEDIVQIIEDAGLNGLITTNTTIGRRNLLTENSVLEDIGVGGLSGAPLLEDSNNILQSARRMLGNEKVIIGVGGICSPEDALQKLKSGADLVQIYSGMVYYGPDLVKDSIELILNGYV